MRSFFRFLMLVLLIAVGVALAIAVVTGSDPASEPSPSELVQTLIDTAGGRTNTIEPESGDTAPEEAPAADVAAAQDGKDQQTPAQQAPEGGDSRQPQAAPKSDLPPTINAAAVYITSPAMAASPAVLPGPVAGHPVPYYPMVANQAGSQVGPPASQAQAGDSPAAAPATAPTSSPDSSDQDAHPSQSSSDSQIRHDEGDDALIINVKDSDIREVLELLSQDSGLNILASQSVSGKVSATLNGVDARTALSAILKSTGYVARYEDDFVYVGTPEDFQSMDQARDVIGMRVYRPNYVTAAELETLVTPLLTEGTGTVTVSSPSEVEIPSDSSKTGGDGFAGGEVLLARDYETVLAQIDRIVEEVDQRPLQVAIEAVILTVTLDDSNRMGVNFELLRNKDNTRIISGMPLNSLANIELLPQQGGLKIGFLDSSLSVLLEALESVGDTNVVASPKVMCLNKQRAEVHIGKELGYITTTVTETAATQTVEFLEVGTQLRIRPFISSDGMIRMEIHPELSTGSLRPVNDMTIPDKEVTQVTSNIMCRDGSTVVIGGLIRQQLGSSTTQIPLLGSLPLVGPAFRQKSEETRRDEIIVLITPRIVHDPLVYAEGQEAMQYARDRIEVFADKMSPIGTRYYGRRYYRKAQAAWAAGDIDTALRYVNLSIHFDRQNADALRLRREIAAACPQADNNIDARLRQGLAPWQHPHTDYSRSGWPWRAPDAAPEEAEIIQVEEVPAPEATGRESAAAAGSAVKNQTLLEPAAAEEPEPEPSPDEDQ